MTVKNVDPATLKEWIKNDEAIIVDVRQPKENKDKRIANSIVVPMDKISSDNLPEAGSKKLVLHCHSGGRSSRACAAILKEDPDCEIYNLEGGITSWIAQGGEYESSGKSFLPLDRQVQLVIGLGVFVGSILGYFVNSKFFLLSGFFGAGLTFAAITGFCGLARFLAKMPWNR